ncbi:carbohydrate ABC transporter permease [Alteribacillus bidgolensis]|uniref:Raffinose/stachyose/melibiose transport system permease protein n=1 Tax=Alteribacillus bidgolensis TaxID=930129 RepID=A0A1G8GX69_9BACI|nr:carbohydrate ABC transporter permease [Alteribacillus bidgolensis]SDH98993.1 raffinose/stachyose/melibiose transport system permease protein [Alteribacillus bidgolensis]
MDTTGKKIGLYSFIIIGALCILFPMYLTVVTAFKSPEESSQSLLGLPSSLSFNNFIQAAEMSNYVGAFFNTFTITVVSIIFIIFIGSIASFAIARNQDQLFYRIMYYFFVSGLFVPFQVMMLPLIQQLNNLDMLNNWGLILLYATYGQFQAVFLYVAYFKSVPREIEDAALIDGCGVFRMFWYVIFPMLKPMTITLVVLNLIWIWNDFLMPLVILQDSSEWTLPLMQYVFESQYTANFNLAFASYLMVLLPVILIYLFLQKHIIGGVSDGAVK